MFSVYLVWNLTHYRLFLCPPFFLDSKFFRIGLGLEGTGWGDDPVWIQLAALTPSLPLGLADYTLNYLADESEKQLSGAKLSAAGKQVVPGIKASGWRYLSWRLKRWRPGTAEFRVDTAVSAEHRQMPGAVDLAEHGQMPDVVGSTMVAAVGCLLQERRQLARQVLLGLEAEELPPGLRLDAEGYRRQLGPIRFWAGGMKAAGAAGWEAGLGAEMAAELEAGLEEELLWLEHFLAGRALLPKEVQALLAENQDRLPAALRGKGIRNGGAWEVETVVEPGKPGQTGAAGGTSTGPEAGVGIWVPARIQATFQALALQGRALLRPAVGRDLRGQSLCYRCGQSDQLQPAGCGHCGRRACYYCESCNSLGLARECLPLYLVPGAKPASGNSGSRPGNKSGTAVQEQERDLAANFHTEKTGKPLGSNEAAAPAPAPAPAPDPDHDLALVPDPVLNPDPVPGPDHDSFQVFKSVPVQLGFPLTPAQQRAAEEVRQFAAASPLKQCLVWAVCGAGKTEVVFPALAEALARGGPVLYATPRRDVVQELAPRLKQAFPGFQVRHLYAGSGDRFASADIYAATTHQTLRFYQNFDLVILDEVDAYPYHDSSLLHYAVLRASRPGGKIIYLTATPSTAMQQQARGGRELAVVYIPARHHGFPVPEPELIGESRLRWPVEDPNLNRNQNRNRELELPGSVIDLIQRAVAGDQVREREDQQEQEQSQLLIFVPAVRLTDLVAEAVSRQVNFDQLKWPMELAKSAESERSVKPEKLVGPVKQVEQVKAVKQIKQVEQVKPPAFPWVQASHAGDPQREQKRQAFSQGDFPVLVTTTILERGITIPRVNVMVLFADAEKIFDEGSLVQMAGRAGRTADFPQGKVWLVGSRVSPAMRLALARIREMNRRARALGYLHEGRG